MGLDKETLDFYESAVADFERSIKYLFGNDMIQIRKSCAFDAHGVFELEYKYVPEKYTILISSEYDVFSIRITDSEGALTYLGRIVPEYRAWLRTEFIEKAMCILKIVLDQNNFSFFIHKDGRVYRKNKNGITRIEDLNGEWWRD